jgi:uncharacterized protein (TIGR00369 family)
MTAQHYRRLEHAYHTAPCHRTMQPELVIGEGRATVRLEIRPDMFHAMNAVHGAFYFKLLDDAAFFAANSVVTDTFVLTVSFNVQFLRPIASGMLIAEGRLRKNGNLLFADSTLADAAGSELARGAGVFARGRHAIPSRDEP